MSDRQIRLSIAPATAATCGDGQGKFCGLVRTAAFGTRWECLIWGSLEDTGWLMRHPKCLDAEKSGERWTPIQSGTCVVEVKK